MFLSAACSLLILVNSCIFQIAFFEPTENVTQSLLMVLQEFRQSGLSPRASCYIIIVCSKKNYTHLIKKYSANYLIYNLQLFNDLICSPEGATIVILLVTLFLIIKKDFPLPRFELTTFRVTSRRSTNEVLWLMTFGLLFYSTYS